MSCTLTKGRNETCNDDIGGIKKIYLFNYKSYGYSDIEVESGVELTSFPSTNAYEYHVVNGSFVENMTKDDNGVKWEQTLTFTIKKQEKEVHREVKKVAKAMLRYIVVLNNGKYKLGALRNGASVTSLELTNGTEKAEGTLYNVTITGFELHKAPFFDNLEDAGFNTPPIGKLYQTGDNFIYQDDDNFIFN